MDQYDRDNLEFLLTLRSEQEWKAWAATVDQEDIEYAHSLLQVARLELIDDVVEKHSDLIEAQIVFEYIKHKAQTK